MENQHNKKRKQAPFSSTSVHDKESEQLLSSSTSVHDKESEQLLSSSTSVHDDEDSGLVVERVKSKAENAYEYLRTLPPGCEFNPTDEQLIRFYLKPKMSNYPLPPCVIHPVNVYEIPPKKLLAGEYLKPHPDSEYTYFFSSRNRKYPKGKRPKRAVTGGGYWKKSGRHVEVKSDGEIIGYRDTLVFYEGKHPVGVKTGFIMHEFKAEDMKFDELVLCKIREETNPSKMKKKKEDPSKKMNDEAEKDADVANENKNLSKKTVKDGDKDDEAEKDADAANEDKDPSEKTVKDGDKDADADNEHAANEDKGVTDAVTNGVTDAVTEDQ